jgi:transposase-like protein
VARRNGYRERAWDTWVGSIELAIPKLVMRCVKGASVRCLGIVGWQLSA